MYLRLSDIHIRCHVTCHISCLQVFDWSDKYNIKFDYISKHVSLKKWLSNKFLMLFKYKMLFDTLLKPKALYEYQ